MKETSMIMPTSNIISCVATIFVSALEMRAWNYGVDCLVDVAFYFDRSVESPINHFNPRYCLDSFRVQASASLFHLNNLKDIKGYCAS
jgi:hypothetical protein